MPDFGLSAKILSKRPGYRDEDNPDADVSGLDPWQYAVPPEYGQIPNTGGDDISNAFKIVNPQQLGDEAGDALRRMQLENSGGQEGAQRRVNPRFVPENLPVSPAASNQKNKTDVEVSPEQELSEKQLLRNYLESLQKRRNTEGELRALNETALERGRAAMLAEGLSESASKMGNLMGTPTGSTMQGFGKEAANLEMTGVDQARKIMEGVDPTQELARQAQISSLLEQIRASRSKTAQGEAAVQGKTEAAATRNAILAGKAPKPTKPAAAPGAAKPTAEQTKLRQQEREFNERYANIQQNLQKLSAMVQSKGTWELTGTHNTDLERLNYMIAIDFAKMFDPESVAREGEVKAAQRYLLPIQPSFEHGYTRPATAQQLIQNMSKDIQQRAQNRQRSMQSVYGTKSASEFPQQPVVPAQSGGKVYLKALTGDNKVKVFSEDQAQQLLQQRQPNGQPMYMRVK